MLGLITAIVVYPFLHESGHSVATMLFGGKVIEFHLLPLPNVLCDIYSISSVGIVIIGVSGMLFPLLIALPLSKKRFALWYMSEVIIGISVYAFFISAIALVLARFGILMPNEDVIKVIQTMPESKLFVFLAAVAFMGLALWAFVKNKPVKRMIEYLEIENPRIA